MSAFELLIDCVKDATKERDELADALDLKDETIQAMESVMAKIGTRLQVPAGDVPALLEAIEQLTAGDTRHPKPECPVQQGWCYACAVSHPYGPGSVPDSES